MRATPITAAPIAAPAVPLLDATNLPSEEDWEMLEALNANGHGFDQDEDRLAGLGFSAGDFD